MIFQQYLSKIRIMKPENPVKQTFEFFLILIGDPDFLFSDFIGIEEGMELFLAVQT